MKFLIMALCIIKISLHVIAAKGWFTGKVRIIVNQHNSNRNVIYLLIINTNYFTVSNKPNYVLLGYFVKPGIYSVSIELPNRLLFVMSAIFDVCGKLFNHLPGKEMS